MSLIAALFGRAMTGAFGRCALGIVVCLTFLLAVQDCLKSVDFFLVSLEVLDLLLKK